MTTPTNSALVLRRVIAKGLDAVVTGITAYGFSRLAGPTTGLLVAYGWFLVADWAGSPGKWLTGLTVRSGDTGFEISLKAAAIRNWRLVLPSLLSRLCFAPWALDRRSAPAFVVALNVLFSCLAIWFAWKEIQHMNRDPQGRREGDVDAHTRVLPS